MEDNRNKIDDLYKQAFDNYSVPYSEEDWSKMKQSLYTQKRKYPSKLWLLIIPITLFLLYLGIQSNIEHGTGKKECGDSIETTAAIPQRQVLKKKPELFYITGKKDHFLFSKFGYGIAIPENAFMDKYSKIVTGEVRLEVSSYLSASDILLANLSTLSNGELLQTGGMILIEAYKDEEKLTLSTGASINIILPEKLVPSGMQYFEGIISDTGINWVNPTNIEKINPSYNKPNTPDVEPLYPLEKEIENFDTVEEYNVEIKSDTIARNEIAIKLDTLNTRAIICPTEEFVEPNYIFSMNKLGWANIDKFYKYPTTKEIDLTTIVPNFSNYNNISITLVIDKMYLPLFQKRDKMQAFTFMYGQTLKLPLGHSAILVAIAYKKNIPYYSCKYFTISEQMNVELDLKQTSLDELKRELNKIK